MRLAEGQIGRVTRNLGKIIAGGNRVAAGNAQVDIDDLAGAGALIIGVGSRAARRPWRRRAVGCIDRLIRLHHLVRSRRQTGKAPGAIRVRRRRARHRVAVVVGTGELDGLSANAVLGGRIESTVAVVIQEDAPGNRAVVRQFGEVVTRRGRVRRQHDVGDRARRRRLRARRARRAAIAHGTGDGLAVGRVNRLVRLAHAVSAGRQVVETIVAVAVGGRRVGQTTLRDQRAATVRSAAQLDRLPRNPRIDAVLHAVVVLVEEHGAADARRHDFGKVVAGGAADLIAAVLTQRDVGDRARHGGLIRGSTRSTATAVHLSDAARGRFAVDRPVRLIGLTHGIVARGQTGEQVIPLGIGRCRAGRGAGTIRTAVQVDGLAGNRRIRGGFESAVGHRVVVPEHLARDVTQRADLQRRVGRIGILADIGFQSPGRDVVVVRARHVARHIDADRATTNGNRCAVGVSHRACAGSGGDCARTAFRDVRRSGHHDGTRRGRQGIDQGLAQSDGRRIFVTQENGQPGGAVLRNHRRFELFADCRRLGNVQLGAGRFLVLDAFGRGHAAARDGVGVFARIVGQHIHRHRTGAVGRQAAARQANLGRRGRRHHRAAAGRAGIRRLRHHQPRRQDIGKCQAAQRNVVDVTQVDEQRRHGARGACCLAGRHPAGQAAGIERESANGLVHHQGIDGIQVGRHRRGRVQGRYAVDRDAPHRQRVGVLALGRYHHVQFNEAGSRHAAGSRADGATGNHDPGVVAGIDLSGRAAGLHHVRPHRHGHVVRQVIRNAEIGNRSLSGIEEGNTQARALVRLDHVRRKRFGHPHVHAGGDRRLGEGTRVGLPLIVPDRIDRNEIADRARIGGNDVHRHLTRRAGIQGSPRQSHAGGFRHGGHDAAATGRAGIGRRSDLDSRQSAVRQTVIREMVGHGQTRQCLRTVGNGNRQTRRLAGRDVARNDRLGNSRHLRRHPGQIRRDRGLVLDAAVGSDVADGNRIDPIARTRTIIHNVEQEIATATRRQAGVAHSRLRRIRGTAIDRRAGAGAADIRRISQLQAIRLGRQGIGDADPGDRRAGVAIGQADTHGRLAVGGDLRRLEALHRLQRTVISQARGIAVRRHAAGSAIGLMLGGGNVRRVVVNAGGSNHIELNDAHTRGIVRCGAGWHRSVVE